MRPAIVLAVLLASSTARAESDDKSPTVATVASVGVTVGSLAGAIGLAVQGKGQSGLYVASAGMLLGPSVGHWYAGEVGVTGLVLRGAGLGLIALTITSPLESQATAGYVIGFGALIAGAMYDFGTAGDSARRANRKAVTLAPAMVAGPHSNAPGLGFSGAF